MTATAAITVAEAEKVCREFAAQFPGPNVDRAVGYAEAGRVSWFQVYRLFQTALNGAVAEVSANG